MPFVADVAPAPVAAQPATVLVAAAGSAAGSGTGSGAEANAPVALANAEAQALVQRYLALHDNPTADGIAALFTPGFEVIGSGPHAGGFRGEAYLQFLLAKKGTRFTQDAGSALQLTADGRVVLHWTLRHGEQVLAKGIDYLTVVDGRIQKIVGVY